MNSMSPTTYYQRLWCCVWQCSIIYTVPHSFITCTFHSSKKLYTFPSFKNNCESILVYDSNQNEISRVLPLLLHHFILRFHFENLFGLKTFLRLFMVVERTLVRCSLHAPVSYLYLRTVPNPKFWSRSWRKSQPWPQPAIKPYVKSVLV